MQAILAAVEPMKLFGFGLPFGIGGNTVAVVILFIIGLILVIKGGDWFVDSASWFAEATGIPKFIVGATVVSFATTLPELLVSVRAAVEGVNDMAVGNAVGSVTCNTTLIMGLSLVAMAGSVNRKSYAIKGGLFVAASVALLLLSLSGSIPAWSAFVLWAIFLVFMADNVIEGKNEAALEHSRTYEKKYDKKEIPSRIFFFVIGTAGIVVGAELLVNGGTFIAEKAGVSSGIIGFTIIALGTSLPELITTVTAIRKKEASMSVGNIVGANVIDLTLILPLCSIITGSDLPVEHQNLVLDFPVCILAAAVAVIPTLIMGKFKKWQGYFLLCLYAVYLVLLVLAEIGVLVV